MITARTDPAVSRQLLSWLTIGCRRLAEFEQQRAYIFGAAGATPGLLGSSAMSARWNSTLGDYTWQRLGGGHRAAGDCRTVIERLREMAAERPSQPDPFLSSKDPLTTGAESIP